MDTEITKNLGKDDRTAIDSTEDGSTNIGNSLAVRGKEVYFISDKKKLRRIDLKANPPTSTEVKNTEIKDVCVADKQVICVSPKGLVTNLDNNRSTQLPCQPDEVYTHIKYGCGMIIAVSFRKKRVEKACHSVNTFHLISPQLHHKHQKSITAKGSPFFIKTSKTTISDLSSLSLSTTARMRRSTCWLPSTEFSSFPSSSSTRRLWSPL